jgi:hypothetical protein
MSKREGGGGAKKPKKTETIGIRISLDLRGKLDRAAKEAGRSLSGEIASRLERSFSEQAALGGPQGYGLIMGLTARLLSAGHNAGQIRFGLGVTTDQWLADSYCYDDALTAAVEFLWLHRPNQTQRSTILWFEALKSRILSRWYKENPALSNFKFPEETKS